MSEQPLDLRRSLRIVRRHLRVVGIATAVGLLAGAGYTATNLPMHAANALVVLPASTADMSTQIVIAGGAPVLQDALVNVHPAVSLPAMRSDVQITSDAPYVLSIMAKAGTAAQAEAMANAVADSYVAYVGAANTPVGRVPAQVLVPARNATDTRLPVRLLATALAGALAGAVAGVIIALAVGRSSRRLRRRDEIADAIGVPVLASVAGTRPGGAAGWTKLLENYEPGPADACRLRNALSELGLADATPAGAGSKGSSLRVLTLSSDPRALALGPQLASFAASLGISTALVIDSQPDSSTAAALRAAATPPSSRRSGLLRVTVADDDDLDRPPATALSVIVTVVDDQNPANPESASPIRTKATLLGVSAGATTPGQLARVAATAAANGRYISGILVADPDPADPTTGRFPQLARPTQGTKPTHLTGTLR
jgi:capsular polysaccharide biosynthesis protein